MSGTVPMGTDGVRLRQRARTCPDGEECQLTTRPAAFPSEVAAPASQALEGLASAEWGQARMCLDEGAYPVAVRARVVAQGPDEVLADE